MTQSARLCSLLLSGQALPVNFGPVGVPLIVELPALEAAATSLKAES